MTACSCHYCDQWIEVSNRRFPGFCSATCRDLARPKPVQRKPDDVERMMPGGTR